LGPPSETLSGKDEMLLKLWDGSILGEHAANASSASVVS
jgi:hypothetical protein